MRIILAAIYPYAFLLLYLIIPFDNYIRALPNILMAILVIAFPFIVKKEDFKKLKRFPIVIFLFLFVFLFVNSFLSGRLSEDFNIIKKVFIAVGLVILYIPVADLKKLKGAIIFSSLAAIVFSVYNFVLITDATGTFALGDSSQVIESLLIDRVYLGLLCILSVIVSFQSVKSTFHPNNSYYVANIIFNLIFIVLIASKIAIIALIVLLVLRQFYGKHRTRNLLITGGILVMGSIVFFMVVKNPREFPTTPHNTAMKFVGASMTLERRSVVWNCANKIAQEEGFTLTGLGFDVTKDKLVSCFTSEIDNKEKRELFVSQRYNTHNQFFDFYLSAGAIALLIFVGFICVSFILEREKYFPTAMLCILIMYCMVENVFHRQIGAYYIGFILIMLFTLDRFSENNNVKKT